MSMKLATSLVLLFGGHAEAFVERNGNANRIAAGQLKQSKARHSLCHFSHFSVKANDEHEHDEPSSPSALTRPDFFRSVGIVAASTASAFFVNPSEASAGLIQFPCAKLQNTYHLLRAGQSLLEEEDILATNPLFLTNRECALSDVGIQQIEEVCEYLNSGDDVVSAPTVVRHSFAAAAIDTANIVGRELRIGRDRLVPEFFFLDPRAAGLWDNLPITQAEPAIWAMDVDEAGRDGFGGRPPANEDGTPAETLADQVPRLRQLLSACESIYSGDTVLLIFPDGTGPALLSCLIAGIPLSRVHELEYRPGELRTDITYDSVRTMLQDKPSEEYQQKIQLGRQELKKLRSQKTVINVKDQRYEQEVKEEERRAAEAAKEREEKQEAERIRREQVAKTVEMQRKENQNPNSDISPTTAASLVGVGALGVGASIFLAQDEDVPNSEPSANVTSISDNSTTQIEDSDFDEKDISVRSINGVPVAEVPSIDSEDFSKEVDTNGDNDNAVSAVESPSSAPLTASTLFEGETLTNEERLQKAETAMDEYMEKDDGADAWLASLSEMISEDETNVDVDNEDDFKGSFQ